MKTQSNVPSKKKILESQFIKLEKVFQSCPISFNFLILLQIFSPGLSKRINFYVYKRFYESLINILSKSVPLQDWVTVFCEHYFPHLVQAQICLSKDFNFGYRQYFRKIFFFESKEDFFQKLQASLKVQKTKEVCFENLRRFCFGLIRHK